MGTSRLTMMLIVFGLLISFSGVGMGKAYEESLRFTYYVHDDFVPPGVTAVQTISVDGSFSGPSQFGDQSVFNSLARKEVIANSTLIGHHSGITTVLNEPNIFIINLTADLSTSEYNGIYTVQGRFNVSKPSWKFVITGGIGSFLGAQGYSTVSVAVADKSAPVFRHDVTMFF